LPNSVALAGPDLLSAGPCSEKNVWGALTEAADPIFPFKKLATSF